jgi:hypothetical protein
VAATGVDTGPTAVNRWKQVSNFSGISLPSDVNAVVGFLMGQAGPGAPGINPLNNGLNLNPGSATDGTLDIGYNIASHAFLYGELDYNLADVGVTTFHLNPSQFKIVIGISNTPGSIDLTNQFTYGSATITVVPEPATAFLLLSGSLGITWLGVRRRE